MKLLNSIHLSNLIFMKKLKLVDIIWFTSLSYLLVAIISLTFLVVIDLDNQINEKDDNRMLKIAIDNRFNHVEENIEQMVGVEFIEPSGENFNQKVIYNILLNDYFLRFDVIKKLPDEFGIIAVFTHDMDNAIYQISKTKSVMLWILIPTLILTLILYVYSIGKYILENKKINKLLEIMGYTSHYICFIELITVLKLCSVTFVIGALLELLTMNSIFKLIFYEIAVFKFYFIKLNVNSSEYFISSIIVLLIIVLSSLMVRDKYFDL